MDINLNDLELKKDLKIKIMNSDELETYMIHRERDQYVLSLDLRNMGFCYVVKEKFNTSDEITGHLEEMEASYNDNFSEAGE